MSNEQKNPIPPLQTITANTLLNTEYPPLAFSIEKLLPQGIFILAGSGKIGKSWLSLDGHVSNLVKDNYIFNPNSKILINIPITISCICSVFE